MTNSSSSSTASASSIVVMGPRASGKTTYLAGLTVLISKKKDFFLDKAKVDATIEAGIAAGVESTAAQELKKRAKNITFSKTSFLATNKNDIQKYRFDGKIDYAGHSHKFALDAVDVPGEGLESIEVQGTWTRNYLEEQISQKERPIVFLLLLGDWEPHHSDSNLCDILDVFRQIMRDKANLDDAKKFRFAVVMNKCERGELWTRRLDPEKDIFRTYFKESRLCLHSIFNDFEIPLENLGFFAMSTFGVLGESNFRPNRDDTNRDGQYVSVLRDVNSWHPYGMLSPIYWLITGRRLPDYV